MTRRSLLLAATLAIPLAVPAAHAQSPAPAPVLAQRAWARATPPGASTGAVYLTLTSPVADTLVAASSPVAQHTGVHEMRMDGAVMRMRALENGLDLPAGRPVELAPGGYHGMLEGLKAPLLAGQTVPLHLAFRNAPPLDVQAQVRPIGASSAGGSPTAGQAHGTVPGTGMGK